MLSEVVAASVIVATMTGMVMIDVGKAIAHARSLSAVTNIAQVLSTARLQAIKKGVMELADLVVINKADIDPAAATRAEAQIASALRLFGLRGHAEHRTDYWHAKVMQISALKNQGIEEFWTNVEQFHQQRRASGEFDARRKQQALAWMWDLIHARLHADFRHHPAVREALPEMLREVGSARIAPSSAARALLARFEDALK